MKRAWLVLAVGCSSPFTPPSDIVAPVTGIAHRFVIDSVAVPPQDAGRCRAATCSDGIRDGFELAVDCGGGCACPAPLLRQQ